jgi:glucosylceramidase
MLHEEGAMRVVSTLIVQQAAGGEDCQALGRQPRSRRHTARTRGSRRTLAQALLVTSLSAALFACFVASSLAAAKPPAPISGSAKSPPTPGSLPGLPPFNASTVAGLVSAAKALASASSSGSATGTSPPAASPPAGAQRQDLPPTRPNVAAASVAAPPNPAPTIVPAPPFTECPAVGSSPSCGILLVVNSDGSVSVVTDPTVGPYDGTDDTLVGIVNDSNAAVQAVTVTGPGSGLGELDGDGLCTYGVSGCPFGPTGYEGPGTGIVTSPSLPDSAEIDFASGLAASGTAYFSLEGALTSAQLTARRGTLGNNVQVWQPQDSVTAPFQSLSPLQLVSGTSQTADVTLQVENDAAHTFQEMAGFGGTLTDSSAYLMDASNPLLPDAQPSSAAIATLFGAPTGTSGIGLDLVRIPIGGNDFSQKNYSTACAQSNAACSTGNNYTDDDPTGLFSSFFGDPSLKSFSTGVDAQYMIPTLKAALIANPSLQFIASPWSAPAWMKCGLIGPVCLAPGTLDGGELRGGEELTYAMYLVRWIEAYQKAGVPIAAITIDNEPFNNNSNYPIMTMSVGQQEKVIEDLGQQLKLAHLSTAIVGLDHNWDYATQAAQLLSSPAGQYLRPTPGPSQAVSPGIAFHAYGTAQPSAQIPLQAAAEPIYEDESTPTGAYAGVPYAFPNDLRTDPNDFSSDLVNNTLTEVIQSVAYGSKSAMLFDLAANGNYGPTINTYGAHDKQGGCGPITPTTRNSTLAHKNCLPMVEISSPGALAVPNVGYAVLGDVSRYVEPDAHRIFSTLGQGGNACPQPPSSTPPVSCDVWSVAFENPDGSIVLVVLNHSPVSKWVAVDWNGQSFKSDVPARMVQTFVWPSS